MLIVHVDVHVRTDQVTDFITATLVNARASLDEPGVIRFDVVSDQGDNSHFVLVEVYRNEEAALAHKETSHYAAWRDTVAPMMAIPRSSTKYSEVFPTDLESWVTSAQ